MAKQSTTAAVRQARPKYERRDIEHRAIDRRDMTPMIHELEAENLGLRDSVVDLALEVAILREALPAGIALSTGYARRRA